MIFRTVKLWVGSGCFSSQMTRACLHLKTNLSPLDCLILTIDNPIHGERVYSYKYNIYDIKLGSRVSKQSHLHNGNSFTGKIASQMLSYQYRNSHYKDEFEGSVQERHNSIANALELRLSLIHRDYLLTESSLMGFPHHVEAVVVWSRWHQLWLSWVTWSYSGSDIRTTDSFT